MKTKDTLDTLAAKAEALEAMRIRKDPNYSEARKLYKQEVDAWQKQMTDDAMKFFQKRNPYIDFE